MLDGCVASPNAGPHRRSALPEAVGQIAPSDAPMFVKVLVAGVSGKPVMGHSGEGRLL